VSRLALLTLAFLAGGCTSFTVPGYRGRAVEYVARPAAEGGGEPAPGLPSPRLLETEGLRIVFYPFRSDWLPRVGLTLPGHHESSLEGWIWIENVSRAPVLVEAVYLRTPGVPLQARVLVRAAGYSPGSPGTSWISLREEPISPGEGRWIHASMAIDRDFAERFELWFGWREGEQGHGIPVAYARQEP